MRTYMHFKKIRIPQTGEEKFKFRILLELPSRTVTIHLIFSNQFDCGFHSKKKTVPGVGLNALYLHPEMHFQAQNKSSLFREPIYFPNFLLFTTLCQEIIL